MRDRHTDLQAGLFVLVSLVLAVGSFWIIGKEREIFSKQLPYYATFTDVKGLREGAPVRLGGITIGRIDEVGFSDQLNDTTVHVTLMINENYLSRISESSVANIETQGLLGDRFLSITTGDTSTPLPPESTIKSNEPSELGEVLQKAGVIVDNTVEISEEINGFISDLSKGGSTRLSDLIKGLSDIVGDVKEGKGLISKLIYSEKDGEEIIANIRKATEEVRAFTKEVRDGKGLLNTLIFDPEGTQLIDNISLAAAELGKTAGEITKIASEVREGEGLLHEVVYASTPGGFDEVISKLLSTAKNLEEASRSLAEGGGTLGALLIDSALYDNLVTVTEGANRSLILRHAIRESLKE